MNEKLLRFGLALMIVSALLGMIGILAKAQTEPPTMQQLCKTDKDVIALDKAVGVNASQITALENLYNDLCGQVN